MKHKRDILKVNMRERAFSSPLPAGEVTGDASLEPMVEPKQPKSKEEKVRQQLALEEYFGEPIVLHRRLDVGEPLKEEDEETWLERSVSSQERKPEQRVPTGETWIQDHLLELKNTAWLRQGGKDYHLMELNEMTKRVIRLQHERKAIALHIQSLERDHHTTHEKSLADLKKFLQELDEKLDVLVQHVDALGEETPLHTTEERRLQKNMKLYVEILEAYKHEMAISPEAMALLRGEYRHLNENIQEFEQKASDARDLVTGKTLGYDPDDEMLAQNRLFQRRLEAEKDSLPYYEEKLMDYFQERDQMNDIFAKTGMMERAEKRSS